MSAAGRNRRKSLRLTGLASLFLALSTVGPFAMMLSGSRFTLSAPAAHGANRQSEQEAGNRHVPPVDSANPSFYKPRTLGPSVRRHFDCAKIA
jgi:hypothetical protein